MCLLCRANPTSIEQADTQALLSSGTNWPALFKLAAHHRVGGLLRHALCRYNDLIPHNVQLRIKRRTLRDIAHRMKLQKAITDILKLLREHHVNTLPIKGMALSEQIYGDPQLRSGNDIDLLVQSRDFTTAHETLIQHGFALRTPNSALSEAKKYYLHQRSHSSVYVADHIPFEIDLHWRLTEIPVLNANLLFDGHDNNYFSLGSEQVPYIALEHYLIYLIMHGAIDQWQHLKSLVDIANIFRLHDNLNYEKLLKLAQEYSCQRPLRQALTLSESWLGLEVPEILDDGLSTSHNKILVKLANNRLFRSRQIHSLTERALFQLTVLYNLILLRPGIKYKWQALRWFFSPGEQHLPVWLPDRFIPLAFILRPFTAFFRPFQ